MKTTMICAILAFVQLSAWTQPNLDSLWAVWSDIEQADSSRLKAIYNYAWEGYLYSNPDSARYFAQLQYDFAESKGLKNHMADALNTQGNSLYFLGDYAEAIEHLTRSLRIAEEIGYKDRIAGALTMIGVIYSDRGDFLKALNYHNRSLEMFKEIGNKQGIASVLTNIGNIYMHQADYANAINSYSISLKTSEEIENKRGIATSLISIGLIYQNQGEYKKAINFYVRSLGVAEELGDKQLLTYPLVNLGNIYKEMRNFGKSMDYQLRSLAIYEEIGDKKGIAISLGNIGNIYGEQGDFEKSIDYFLRSLSIFEKVGDAQGMASCLNEIGITYRNQGEFIRALDFCERSLKLLQEIGAVRETRNVAETLSGIYKEIGDYKQSLAMHELYIQMRDSIQSEENIKEMARFEFKYEYEKKALADSLRHVADLEQKDLQTEVEVAQAETERNIYISAGAAILMLSFLFFQRRHNRNRLLLKEQEANYQKELLHATINSQENERRRIARDLHDEVGAMLSAIKLQLKATGKKLQRIAPEDPTENAVTMVDETISNVRRISKDLLPPTLEEFGLAHALEELAEKIEQASGIKVNTNLSPTEERMGLERELSLYRVIQEMANNAMKHAEATEFHLTMKEENGQLELRFSDNGKGFDIEKVKRSKDGKRGLGLKNLENRVGAAGGRMQLNSEIGKGTTLRVEMLTADKNAQAA